MKKSWIVGAVALLVLLAGGVSYVVLAQSEEAKIKKVLERLAHAVEPRANANPIFELARVRSEYDEILTERVEVSVPDIGGVPSARSELAQATVAAGSRYGASDIEIADVTIKIDDAKTRADVDCMARMKRSGSTFSREERRVHFSLRNDDRWRVSSVNVSAPVSR